MLYLLFGGEGGNWKWLKKGVFFCNVGMCAVVTGWGRGMELERVTEKGFCVLYCGDVCCSYCLGRGGEFERVTERG